ncbi:MAG: helix-turn-helix transcriptional regulator [Planctomycetota bacterium]
MTPATVLPNDLRTLHGANVRRLMAQYNMTQSDVVTASGLDERTVRGILRGASRPHAKTLHKLAEGLGVATDELFQDPYQSSNLELTAEAFDLATNPVAAQVVDAHPEEFKDWTSSDFNELFSRMAVGGELTETGTLSVVRDMNQQRELMYQVAVILESDEADLMREFVKLLYQRATDIQ